MAAIGTGMLVPSVPSLLKKRSVVGGYVSPNKLSFCYVKIDRVLALVCVCIRLTLRASQIEKFSGRAYPQTPPTWLLAMPTAM